jgi:hypothetical protein
MLNHNHIALFKSLFQGRQDVYAVRWEKDGKSGYMPAYKVDWSDYNKHKASGGSFKDYSKKEYLPFTEEAIINHLSGKKTVGVYPLLEDNTSHFIAADFDEENWKESILKLHQTCSMFEIPSYIERSRSGNGGHLWIFFEENLPAEQSRKLMFELLREATIISYFEKEPSFDRLFPNQNFHSGKGLGNLIALPLNGNAMQKGNSIFLDTETFEPYYNQFETIASFKKISKDKFLSLYEGFFNQKPQESIKSIIIPATPTKIEIQISNQVYLKRFQLNKKLITFLRDNLNFLNSDYLIKKNMGKSTFDIEKYFRLIEETTEEIIVPRGFVANIVNFCKQESISFKVIDNRKKLDPVEFDSEIELLPHQKIALEKIAEKDFGVIVSPPGSGKTIIGLEIIAQKSQPALIVVHRKQLFDQWIERIQSFLKISKREIGQIGNQKFTIGKEITVAMIQSLTRYKDISKIANSFGTIIVDECHHIPAKSFREAIVNFNSFYLYGLTATPKRKNNDEKHPSKPYNPDIANALFRSGYIESWGRGTLKMINECIKLGIPKPKYFYDMSGFWVEFRKDVFDAEYFKSLGLNERQIQAIKFVKENGKITNSEYQAINDVSKATATRDLSELVEKFKFLSRTGEVGAGTNYILIGS